MTAQTEKSIFLAAIEINPAAERAAFLSQACADNEPLRAKIEALLQAHDQPLALLDAPGVLGATIDDPVSERPGTVIGPYKLMEQIGEGGMGLVFVAEQQQPVRRKVALKVIKPGMDTRQIIARFEAERQALAIMDHPNIAKVLDGGATAGGRPYFVMELVKGVPITDYCDQNQVSIRQRLELFVSVCQAVQHAHQKGIIHRDLKPSNVLVMSHDGTPVVKVIDFGVAKAIGQQLTDKTIYTQFSQMVGTPLYMSPEQAGQSGLDVDTRSDIYSLGVLLYELLTGTTPFDREHLREASYDEIRRVIREEEPPRPSTRISTLGKAATTVSTQRQSEPKQLSRLLRGELDWIVMKALEKDRGRRYETANDLAMDVRRYLSDEPVLACPPSAWYRFRKFARRNKPVLAFVGLILSCIAVVGGSVGWLMRDRLVRQREVEGRTLEALTVAEPRLCEGQAGNAALVSAAQRVEALLESESLVGEVRRRAQQFQRDMRMLVELDEIRLKQAESNDGAMFDTAGAEKRYAEAFSTYGLDVANLETQEAAARIRASVIREALLAGLDAWIQVLPLQERERLRALADSADENAWRRHFRGAALAGDVQRLKALAGQEEALAQTPSVLAWLGLVLNTAGLRKEAESILRQAQERYPQDFWINYYLGHFLMLGPPPHKPDEAAGFFRAAVAIRPSSAEARSILGLALFGKGDTDGAIAVFRQAIALDPKFTVARGNLGQILRRMGRLDEAISEFRAALQIKMDDAGCHDALGSALAGKGRLDEAIAEYSEAIRLKPDSWESWWSRGQAYLKQGQRDKGLADFDHVIDQKPTDARAWFQRGYAYSVFLKEYEKATSDSSKAIELNPKDALAWYNRGVDYEKLHQYDKARADYSKVIELDPTYALAWAARGKLYLALGQRDKALADYSKAIELDPKSSNAHNGRGNLYLALGQRELALADYSKAIELDPKNSVALLNRGFTYYRIGELERAVADYSKLSELNPKNGWNWLMRGDAYLAWGQLDNAQRDYAKGLELMPKSAQAHNDVAWKLASFPVEKLRDPKRAAELAKKAVELAPNEGSHWNTLGAALYRCQDFQSAITALQRSMALRKGGDSFDWFFLAMAQWQLGNQKEARTWYDKAVAWQEKNQPKNDELKRFREEAQKLLGVKENK